MGISCYCFKLSMGEVPDPRTVGVSSRLHGLSASINSPWGIPPAGKGRPIDVGYAYVMKHMKLVIALLTVAAFAVACKPSEQKSTQQQLDKFKQETKEAAQDMKDYAYAQKVEFTEKMKNQLAEINRDLDQLSAKIEKSSDAVKAEAKPKLQALREQTAQLNQQMDEVKNATESTWDTAKSGTLKAYDALKEGFQQSRQWVSDKIAP